MKVSSNNTNDGSCPTLREYSSAQKLVNNIPYMAMIVLGAAVFVFGFRNSAYSPTGIEVGNPEIVGK